MKPLKPKNHDEYISSFPEAIQNLLQQIRNTIKKTIPDVEETIRYDMPAFKINKVHIYFAAYKNHIGMYPMYGMENFEEDLSPYWGKGTKDSIHFPYNKPLPLELIKRIVKFKEKVSK
jgi:uncharacterized protein YdhG (YjbR/CyaY superfamily)